MSQQDSTLLLGSLPDHDSDPMSQQDSTLVLGSLPDQACQPMSQQADNMQSSQEGHLPQQDPEAA